MAQLWVRFESHSGDYPEVLEGPFVWVEMIGSNMFGLRPEWDPESGLFEGEAEEIAGTNEDGTWDAGPYEEEPSHPGVRGRRRYDRWTITTREES